MKLYTQELADKLLKELDGIEIKANEEDKDFVFDVIATTQDTDRDNEVIMVDGRDTKNWEKNPVILANHDYTIESIIGKGIKFYTHEGKKRLKGVFSKSNPLGVLAQQLYKEGMLNTVSVGFIPRKRNEQNYRLIEKAELLEVSFVAVPANPNAVRLDGKIFDEAVAKGLIIKQEEAPSDQETPPVEPVQEYTPENPSVTPCEGCQCEKCVSQSKILEAILEGQKKLQDQINDIGTQFKSLADNNVKDLDTDDLIDGKKVLQDIDNALNEGLRNLKSIIVKSKN